MCNGRCFASAIAFSPRCDDDPLVSHPWTIPSTHKLLQSRPHVGGCRCKCLTICFGGTFKNKRTRTLFFFALFAWQVQKWCCGAVFVWQNSLRDKSPVALWLLLRSGRTPLPLLWKCTHVLNDYLLGICVLRFGGGTRVNVAQQNPFQRRKGQKNFFFVVIILNQFFFLRCKMLQFGKFEEKKKKCFSSNPCRHHQSSCHPLFCLLFFV